jgi:hypothetical protein
MPNSWRNSLQRLLEGLQTAKGVIGVLVSLVLTGFGTGLAVNAHRIEALERRAQRLEVGVDSLRQDVRDIRRTNATQLCLTIAERQRRPWQECLKGLDP